MGTYFVVQVQTGFEIEVKEMMKSVLVKKGNAYVKTIHAMETFTEVINTNNKENEVDLSCLDSNEISEHLYIRTLQSSLTNLRNAYESIKNSTSDSMASMIDGYKENIKRIASELKEIREKSKKKIGSILSGYILIELNVNFHRFPSELWHLVKSIPRVVGFPSENNVPQEEIDYFFQTVDMSDEVEIQFDEILDIEMTEDLKEVLLDEVNRVKGTEKAEEIIEIINNIEGANIVEEVSEVMKEVNSLELKEQLVAISPILKSLDKLKGYIEQGREKVRMSVALFHLMYPEPDISKSPSLVQYHDGFKRKGFIERLKDVVKDITQIRLESLPCM